METKKNIFIEIFGWYGTVGVIAAYALSSFSVVSPTSLWYQVLNVTAAVGVMTVSYYKKAYQPAVLNLIWALIAIAALAKILI